MFQLFDGAQAVAAGVLRGLQDTRVPMLIAAFGYWVAGFGTAIVARLRTRLDGVGIWIGLAVGLAVVSRRCSWRAGDARAARPAAGAATLSEHKLSIRGPLTRPPAHHICAVLALALS